MQLPVEGFVCRFCAQPLEPGAAVCHSCGSLLDAATDIVPHAAPDKLLYCPHCQATLAVAARVCHSCGSLLG